MSESCICNIRTIAVSRIGCSIAAASKGVSLGCAEGLALEKHPSRRHFVEGREGCDIPIRTNRERHIGLESKVIQAGDRSYISADALLTDGSVLFDR